MILDCASYHVSLRLSVHTSTILSSVPVYTWEKKLGTLELMWEFATKGEKSYFVYSHTTMQCVGLC